MRSPATSSNSFVGVSGGRPRIMAVGALAAILGFVLILTWGLRARAGGLSVVPFPRERNVAEVVLNVAIFAVPSLIISGLLALTLRYSKALILKTFVLSGAFFAIVMFQSSIAVSESLLSALLLWLLMCLIVFSALFSIMGFLPEGVNNAVYMVYGAIFGTFFGVNSPTYSLILFVAIYSIYDVFFSRWVGSTLSKSRPGYGDLSITISFESIEIGLGDIIFYSIMASHAQQHFEALVASISVILILTGSIISIVMAEKHKVFPGLPLSMGLGIMPIIGHLLLSH